MSRWEASWWGMKFETLGHSIRHLRVDPPIRSSVTVLVPRSRLSCWTAPRWTPPSAPPDQTCLPAWAEASSARSWESVVCRGAWVMESSSESRAVFYLSDHVTGKLQGSSPRTSASLHQGPLFLRPLDFFRSWTGNCLLLRATLFRITTSAICQPMSGTTTRYAGSQNKALNPSFAANRYRYDFGRAPFADIWLLVKEPLHSPPPNVCFLTACFDFFSFALSSAYQFLEVLRLENAENFVPNSTEESLF